MIPRKIVRHLYTFLALGTVFAMSACGGGGADSTAPAAPQVGSVSVTLPASTLQVGATLSASAEVRSTSGAVLTGRAVTWTSSNSASAIISDGGLVTAIAPGAVTITATSDGKTGTATLTVIPAPVNAVVVTAASSTLITDRTLQATVTLRDERGAALTGRTVTWSSSAPAVATVSDAGLVTGVAAGSVVITATSEGKSGTLALTVVPPPVNTMSIILAQSTIPQGTTTTATVQLRDDRNVALTGRSVTFASSDPTVASVTDAGVITALAVGSTTITATSEGKSATAQLTVIQPPVATVTLSTPQAVVTVGSTTQVTATLRAGDGTVLNGRSVSWVTSAPSVATVANGLVTAVSAGSAVITGTSEGRSGTLSITVQPAAPATIAVTPGASTLSVGRTATLTASVLDASGNTLPNATVSWSSSNSAIAGVSQTGVVNAIAPGVATITASSGGRTGSAQITVQNVAAASIALDVANLTIAVGDVRLVRATVRDALQNVLRGRDVTWSTSNRLVVDGQVLGDSAVITGVGTGSAIVTAAVEGRSASLLVNVVSGGQSVCGVLAGAVVYGDDGQYLGRFTNQFDSQSILNEYGAYGSPYRSTSTNNEYGTYGSPYSSLSARNPYASRPPSIFKNGQFLAYYTVNTAKSPRVSPAVALSCNFP